MHSIFSGFNTTDTATWPWLDYFAGLPLVIQIAAVSIVVSVCFILFIQFRILQTRIRGYRLQKRLDRINPIIDAVISEQVILRNDLMADGASVDNIPLDLSGFEHPVFRRSANRQLLLERLISYRKSFGGKTGALLRRIYLELGLEKMSFSKMKSFRWNNKVKGIRELTDMDIIISDVNILPLTNSKRHELRSEARNAYIKLSKNEPFKFFDISTEPLLMWDQIELFKTITTTENIAVPNFARWVTYSNNKSIISFCLKLIVYYNQTDAAPAVVRLLDNKDHVLRAEAINCLGKLKYEEVEQQLIHIYSNQPLRCQIEILKAVGRFETGKSTAFLKQEFLYSTDFDIRKNAALSLVKSTHDPALITELIEASSEENQLIIKHSMNPLIKY
ncbi:MAG: hypothetical protein BGO09_00160 [Bacteroidetes bacterium 47-18]|nr:MAG: hypothetical protein BGO09_00160 [Bacteroidetes bacterium 47-18]